MKKQYISPSTEIQKVQVCTMIAQSYGKTTTGKSMSFGGQASAEEEGNAKSRGDDSDGWSDGLW